jgi:hypothetical protein
MEGLGVGGGSQRHKAVLTLTDNERNAFVFTVFEGLPSRPREYLGERRTLPSRRTAAHTELGAVHVGKVPRSHKDRPVRADSWNALGRPLAARGRTAQDAGDGRAAIAKHTRPSSFANA